MEQIRSPIVCVLGHVDHGKTTILDTIRGSAVADKEAGRITQMIGASYIPKEAILRSCKSMMERMKLNVTIPGLLFIDTPGHEAFTTLRERGGSIADIAILVVDIAQGLQPQTIESIKILKHHKTPFVIAANKVDLVHGWKSSKDCSKGGSILDSINSQQEHTKQELDNKIYTMMGAVSEHGFDSERFDRITDFTKQVAIIPLSAKTKEGFPELLAMIAGLSQRFLEKNLGLHEDGKAEGSILEVKEEKGLGTTVDCIIYDGVLRKGEEIFVITSNGPKRIKIRALLEPNVSSNNPNERYTYLDSVVAASGVKIFASGLEDVIPGSPVVSAREDTDEQALMEQFKSLVFESQETGVIIKANSLGSVEAILKLFKDSEIPVKKADVGKITRKDVLEAQAVKGQDKYLGLVFGFDVPVLPEAKEESENSGTPVIWSNIIYHLVERYEEWKKEEKEKEKKRLETDLTWPGKIKILNGCIFRASKPAIFGVEVKEGRIKPDYRFLNKGGAIVGTLKGIQHNKENIQEATRGMQVAISSDDLCAGKDVKEEDMLYTYMTEDERETWLSKLSLLTKEEKQILQEIEDIIAKDAIHVRKFI